MRNKRSSKVRGVTSCAISGAVGRGCHAMCNKRSSKVRGLTSCATSGPISVQQGDLRLSGPPSGQGAVFGGSNPRSKGWTRKINREFSAIEQPTAREGKMLTVRPVHKEVISGFQALLQARAPTAGLELATEGSLQIFRRIRYPLCHRHPCLPVKREGKKKRTRRNEGRSASICRQVKLAILSPVTSGDFHTSSATEPDHLWKRLGTALQMYEYILDKGRLAAPESSLRWPAQSGLSALPTGMDTLQVVVEEEMEEEKEEEEEEEEEHSRSHPSGLG
ncbi:hypothetical protein PoB_001327300 [Plakobranchus ocellatus]|uniref:Uncharacterized protein n=1 Tax=Plakobranchus ocellatus TaxID=259542 RepID=A0AAV3YX07_9GAST|nr:hypothetical protein PoB_001327300 [Plakobranchus ocellatus]